MSLSIPNPKGGAFILSNSDNTNSPYSGNPKSATPKNTQSSLTFSPSSAYQVPIPEGLKNLTNTGASSGIGAETAIQLSNVSSHIYIIGRNIKNLEIIKSDLENNLIFLKGSIPGSKNSLVLIQKNSKKINRITTLEKIKKLKTETIQTAVKTKSKEKNTEKKDKPEAKPATKEAKK